MFGVQFLLVLMLFNTRFTEYWIDEWRMNNTFNVQGKYLKRSNMLSNVMPFGEVVIWLLFIENWWMDEKLKYFRFNWLVDSKRWVTLAYAFLLTKCIQSWFVLLVSISIFDNLKYAILVILDRQNLNRKILKIKNKKEQTKVFAFKIKTTTYYFLHLMVFN